MAEVKIQAHQVFLTCNSAACLLTLQLKSDRSGLKESACMWGCDVGASSATMDLCISHTHASIVCFPLSEKLSRTQQFSRDP